MLEVPEIRRRTMKFSRSRDEEPGRVARRRRWYRPARRQDPTHRPDLEPAHDQPWVPTNALTDRIRRSPRQ
jgi:hypothetical protein